MKKYLFFICIITGFAFASQKELFTFPESWPQPEYNFNNNPLNENAILLGKVLFYDPILSANNMVSCESCHSPYSAFAHIDHPLSHGIYDSIGTRNAPALINLAWKKSFMWDGAINNLDMQALAPISHASEMGSSINEVIDKLNNDKTYKTLFKNAFGDSLATGEKTLKAIAQFMVTIVSSNSKYDKVMLNEAEFTNQEKSGYQLFQNNCSSCHREPLFTTDEFANNGLPPNSTLQDWGRVKITGDSKDSLKFKIPTLRNIAYTYPYMHDGRFNRLSEVLNHYSNNIHQSATLAPQLKNGVSLSSNDKVDLISFLLTLSDSSFVFNKQYRYQPITLSSLTKK